MSEEVKGAVPPSESVERAWASNDKALYDILLEYLKGATSSEIVQLQNLIESAKLQAANNKVQFDNLVANAKLMSDNAATHCKALMNYSEQGVAQALQFQQKANDLFLAQMDAREKMDAEHKDAREKADAEAKRQHLEAEMESKRKHLDNDRYTLDRLFSVFPEEASGLVPLLKAILQVLESQTTK